MRLYVLYDQGVVFVLLFHLLFISCDHRDVEKNELVFWSANNNSEIEFARACTEEWNRVPNHTHVHHQPVPEGQSSEEIILAAVVGGTTPDIYANMWQGSVEMYANAGVLVPLDTIPGFTDFIRQRSGPAVLDEITSSDGHIYQVPWKINPIMTIYNQRLLQEIESDHPPGTYSEYLQAGAEVKEDSDGDGYIDKWIGYTEVKAIWYQRFFNFYPLYLAASKGGHLVENNRAAFNNEYAIQVFQFLQSLYRENYFTRERLSASQDRFLKEDIYTKWTGPWEISHVDKFLPHENFNYDFYPMQVPDGHDGPIYTYADPKNIVLFNTCQDPVAAWKFIRTLIQPQGDRRLLDMTGQLPRRIDMVKDTSFSDYFEANPKAKIFAEQANFVKGVDNCEVIVEVFDIISQEYEACVIYDMKSPEQAIQDAAEAVNILLMNE